MPRAREIATIEGAFEIGSKVALHALMRTERRVRAIRQEVLPSPPLIKHHMSEALHSVGRDQPLAVAHAMMRDHGLRHLPVLEGGKLVGLLSERDLFFLESIAGVNPEIECVEQAMTQDVYCVSPEATIADVAGEMAAQRYGCAVVVEGSKVVGMFTTTDALELLSNVIRPSVSTSSNGK